MAQGAGAKRSEIASADAVELVRRAYRAFAADDATRLRSLCHDSLELRPVDALGLVGETLEGFDAACNWVLLRRELGYEVSIWVRTLEEAAPDTVLGVGVVSEHGRTGHGYAATVAWIWHLRDGLIDYVRGYSSEAAARRALNGRT
ncbi:MAG TPA: nuclear transport factor 2 family protein [Thermoleophilaceae bacterium]